jgi:hypothetical protein
VEQALDVLASQSHCNLYLGNLVRRSLPHGRRGASADVTHVFALKIDIDIADGQHTGPNLAPSLEAALAVMEHSPIPHSALVFTGGGIQAWWFIELTTDLARAADLSARLTRYFQERSPYKVDSTHDLARVFRLPGSINWKTGAPRPTQLLALDPAVRYTLADIEATLPIVQPKRQGGPTPKAKSASGHEVQQLLSHIPGHGLDYDEWFKVIAAVKYELGDEGFGLLEDWTGAYCAPGELRTKWNSLRKTASNPATIGTLRHHASQHGYQEVDHFLKPTRLVHTPYLDAAHLASERKVVAIRSDRGTGKTTAIAKLVADEPQVLGVGHRRLLLRNLGASWDAEYYQDIEPYEADRLVITTNSLFRLVRDAPRTYRVIIIDEVEQVLDHVTHSENGHQAQAILSCILKQAEKVYVADADLTHIGIKWAARLAGVALDQVEVIVNSYHQSDLVARVYQSYADWAAQLEQAIGEDKRLHVSCNTKEEADRLEHHLRKRFPDAALFAITSDNSQSEEVQQILQVKGCPGFTAFQVLITSPALGTGVSIDGAHFDAVFAYGQTGVAPATSFVQGIHRVRTLRDRELHLCIVGAQGEAQPEDTHELTANRMQVVFARGFATNSTCTDVSDDHRDALDAWADYEALRNASMNRFRVHTLQLLRDEGISVTYVERTGDHQQVARDLAAAGHEVLAQRVTAVLTAPDISASSAELIRSKSTLSADDRAVLTHHDMRTRYGQPPTEELVISHLKHHLAERLDNWKDFRMPEVAIAFDARQADTVPIALREMRALKAELRREAIAACAVGEGFQEPIAKDALATWLAANEKRLELVLGVRVGKRLEQGHEVKVLTDIIRPLGLKARGKQRAGGERTYWMCVETVRWMDALLKSHLMAQPQIQDGTWVVHNRTLNPSLYTRDKSPVMVAAPHPWRRAAAPSDGMEAGI